MAYNYSNYNKKQQPAPECLHWYTMEEVSKHTDPKRSIWIVINGFVLDITGFLHEHPGGADILIEHAGKDVTDMFESIHSTSAKMLSKSFIIGKVLPNQQKKR